MNILQQPPLIMGVVNVTPDSFSDGGQYFDPETAIVHGLKLLDQGADILDIGGESTRPGAHPVSVKDEIARVIPVIEGLSGKAKHIAIDTRNSVTMEAALTAGATIINDVSGLTHDDRSVFVSRDAKCPTIIMHAQGSPQKMQENPIYNNVIDDLLEWFKMRISYCETHRIDAKNLILDPGIGFGKMLEHNLIILSNLKIFHDLGCPLLLGASRKSFIGEISGGDTPDDRIGGSLAAALWGLLQGVQMFRVHDVAQTRQAFDVYKAISGGVSIGW